MRSLICLISLLCFLPLQAGVFCNHSQKAEAEFSPCHEHKVESENLTNQHGMSLSKSSHEIRCAFCEAGLCRGFEFPKEQAFEVNKKEKQQIGQLHPLLTPLIISIDLQAPIKINNYKEPPPILAMVHSWQSFYSIFII